MNSSIKHGMDDGITGQMESGFQISFWEIKTYFEIVQLFPAYSLHS